MASAVSLTSCSGGSLNIIGGDSSISPFTQYHYQENCGNNVEDDNTPVFCH